MKAIWPGLNRPISPGCGSFTFTIMSALSKTSLGELTISQDPAAVAEAAGATVWAGASGSAGFGAGVHDGSLGGMGVGSGAGRNGSGGATGAGV